MSSTNGGTSFSKSQLMAMFGGNAIRNVVKAPVEEEVPQDYKMANRSMAQRTQQLKIEVASGKRQIELLRNENEKLRERIRKLESATDEEKLELILTERLKNKMTQLVTVAHRTLSYMDKAKSDFEQILGSIGADDLESKENIFAPPAQGRKRVPLCDLDLENVEESPVKLQRPVDIKTEVIVETSTVKRKGRPPKTKPTILPIPDPDATPKVVPNHRRLTGKVEIEEESPSPNATPTKLELCTPRFAPKSKNRAPETPACLNMEIPNPFLETDTVRRKRQAATKIKSFVLPSLNQKMRRPGKNDEPCPYIS